MDFTLRAFQDTAVREVIKRIQQATKDPDDKYVVTLSAPTGAGKTVMASAVIEALLHGSAELAVDPSDSVTVLWFSHDPALNRQTRARILESSSKLAEKRLVEIESGFDQQYFDAGTVYFLNSDKLGSATTYSKSGTDLRTYSVQQTIENTADLPGRTLLLILDEAHQGFSSGAKSDTIISRLVKGATPIVWGISATPERFTGAVQGTGRIPYPEVKISTSTVAESGLIKRDLHAVVRKEQGSFHSTYLRRAADELLDVTARWNAYSAQNDLPKVHPLLIVQVQDKAEQTARLGEIVAEIRDVIPEFDMRAFAHTFDSHASIELASGPLAYCRPELIRERTHIRVVLTKQALTTGWDCPRAEVMYSERPAKDVVLIAQTLGRLTRAPLTHLVDTDDTLNRAIAWLPEYDEASVTEIVDAYRDGVWDGGDLAGEPGTFERIDNPAIFDALESTPTYTKPSAKIDPITRAFALARLLHDTSAGSIDSSAIGALRSLIQRELEGLTVTWKDSIATAREDIVTVDSQRISIYDGTGVSSDRDDASARDLDAQYRIAKRALPEGIVDDYFAHRFRTLEESDDDIDTYELKADVAALVAVQDVIDRITATVEAWADDKIEKVTAQTRSQNAEAKRRFDEIRGATRTARLAELRLPDRVSVAVKTADGASVETFDDHVFADADGKFPAKIDSDWERHVITTEMTYDSTVAWYRNPRGGSAAVTVPAAPGDELRAFHPDLVFLSKTADGEIKPYIVDPHLAGYADAVWKLRGLAHYAAEHSDTVIRVEAVHKVGDVYRVLDFLESEVRDAVLAYTGSQAVELYESHGRAY